MVHPDGRIDLQAHPGAAIAESDQGIVYFVDTGAGVFSIEATGRVVRRDGPDRVLMHGVPDVEMEIKGGVHGDRATAAMVVNSIPRVVQARPGVLTMDDIPVSFR